MARPQITSMWLRIREDDPAERTCLQAGPLEIFLPWRRLMLSMFSFRSSLSLLMIPSLGDANSPSSLMERGNELCNSGNFKEAIEAYDAALKADRTLVDAWNNKGIAQANLGDFDDALKSFDEALKISPKHVFTMNNKGMVLGMQDKFEEALRCFEAAIAVDQNFAGAWHNKGLALDKLGKTREAAGAFKVVRALEGRGGGGCCRR